MGIGSDLRFAARQLWRTRGLSAAAVVTVALAVGANTAVFSLVRAVLLRPLPFAGADELVVVWGKQPGSPFPRLPLSYPDYRDLREGVRSLSKVAAWSALDDYRVAITGAREPLEVRYGVASADLFAVLGVDAAVGRTFTPDERAAAAGQEVLISHRLWSSGLGGDPAVVGGKLVLDGKPYVVAGVLPAGFRFGAASVDVWYPLLLDPAGSGPRSRMYARGAKYLGVVGRREPAAADTEVRAELSGVAARLARENPDFDAGLALEPVPLREQVVGPRRPTLLLLWAAVAAVLLVGCANLANLQLVRAVQREGELALRGALGAGRLRLARQLFAESALVAALGGALGIAAASFALRFLPALAAAREDLFNPFVVAASEVRLDLPVLGFTALVILLTAILSGLAPAWQGGRSVAASLRPGPGTSSGPRQRRRADLLVAGQIALSLVLLFTAALLVRSLAALGSVELGFQPRSLVGIGMRLAPAAYASADARIAFFDALLPRLAALPGVEAAAVGEQLPLQGPQQTSDIRAEGLPEPRPEEEVLVHNLSVSPGYLAAMGIHLRAGRDLDRRDGAATLPVALINESLAHRLWPGQNAIGKRLAMSLEALRFRADGPPTLDFASAYRTVVGVVADVRQEHPERPPLAEMYVPYAQRAGADTTLVLRSALPPATLQQQVAQVVSQLDGNQPLGEVFSLEAAAADAVVVPRTRALLTSLFAAVALLLACVGLYGILAHAVASNRRELGVRVALGARRRQILALVAGRAGRMVLAGAASGLLAALLLRGALATFLFDLAPEDPWAIAAALACLTMAALLATAGPIHRATTVEPAVTLRTD